MDLTKEKERRRGKGYHRRRKKGGGGVLLTAKRGKRRGEKEKKKEGVSLERASKKGKASVAHKVDKEAVRWLLPWGGGGQAEKRKKGERAIKRGFYAALGAAQKGKGSSNSVEARK